MSPHKTIDYNEKLTQDYEDIRRRVERGMLPLVARNPAIERAVSDYMLARAEYYESLRQTPIKYGEDYAIERFADLILYEELRWSHPDKMSIVDYPIMSDRQADRFAEDHSLIDEVKYGDRRHLGRKKSHFTDDFGAPQVRNTRLVSPESSVIERTIDREDLMNALENAGLTDKQRSALEFVYIEGLTQEEAGKQLGVQKHTVNNHIKVGLRKVRNYINV